VTVAKRDYRLDNDTIKHLVYQQPDSKVIETTYSHLSDDDFVYMEEEAVAEKDDTEAMQSKIEELEETVKE